MADIIKQTMQPVAKFSSMSTPAPAVNLVAKPATFKEKAAGVLRQSMNAFKQVASVGLKDMVRGASGVAEIIKVGSVPGQVYGLVKDKVAQYKSEKALTGIRAKAAEALGSANRKNAALTSAVKNLAKYPEVFPQGSKPGTTVELKMGSPEFRVKPYFDKLLSK